MSHVGGADIWIRMGGEDAWSYRAVAVVAHESFHVARNRFGTSARTAETLADEERSANRFAVRMLRELGLPLPHFLKGRVS